VRTVAILNEKAVAARPRRSVLPQCRWAVAGKPGSIVQWQRREIRAVPASKLRSLESISSFGSRELAAVDDLRGCIGIQIALKRALAKLAERWDVVLIDCSPNPGALSSNALAAADEVSKSPSGATTATSRPPVAPTTAAAPPKA